ncbi:hypothetical protein GCM10019016_005890 [Streptomyces prasinosporus]|uniref:Uncharacterized protein n=1 Tax=Streptomyces prasinosporus TaxID=68256 RepID=A0ABP6TFH0_9ACTN
MPRILAGTCAGGCPAGATRVKAGAGRAAQEDRDGRPEGAGAGVAPARRMPVTAGPRSAGHGRTAPPSPPPPDRDAACGTAPGRAAAAVCRRGRKGTGAGWEGGRPPSHPAPVRQD